MLNHLELAFFRALYARADKVQKASLVNWMTGLPPAARPDGLTSVEETLAASMPSPGACPRCGNALVKNGHHEGHQRFICKVCRKTVGRARGTPMAGLKKPYKLWLAFERCMVERRPLRECARICSISLPTAVAWRHRYLTGIAKVFTTGLREILGQGIIDPNMNLTALDRLVQSHVEKVFRSKRKVNPGRRCYPP